MQCRYKLQISGIKETKCGQFEVSKWKKMERKEVDDKKEKKEEEVVHLRREIGLLPAVCFIIGTVVGSGIFIAPKGVLMNSGSVGLSLLVWALCGVLSLFGKVANAIIHLGCLG